MKTNRNIISVCNTLAAVALAATPVVAAMWNSNSAGTWNNSTKWLGGVPTTIPNTAVFPNPPVVGVTVTQNINPSLDFLTFANSTGYRIQGASPTSNITFGGPTLRAIVTSAGTNTIDSRILLAKDIDIDTIGLAVLNLERDISAPTRDVRKVGTGTLRIQQLELQDFRIAMGTVQFMPINSGQAFSRVSTLTITPGQGGLDLFNQPLLIDYTGASPVNTIQGYVNSATKEIRSTSTGILSTARIGMGVGYYDTAWVQSRYHTTSPYMNNAVDTSTLIVRDTLIGDANLDLNVDFNDMLVMAQNYGLPNLHWYQGEFDGLPGVTFNDLLALAQNYGRSYLETEPSQPMDFAADWALARSMVPEPASIVIGSLLMLPRRHRPDTRDYASLISG